MINSKVMNEIAGQLDYIINEQLGTEENGFIIIVFAKEGEEKSRAHYSSNCGHEEMMTAMKEIIKHLEGKIE